MTLKSGTWKLNVNGTETDFEIESVSNSGGLTGFIRGTGTEELSISGFWDEVSQSISFNTHRPDPSVSPGPLSAREITSYRGYLFSTPTQPTPGEDVLWTLTGSVQAGSVAVLDSAVKASSRRTVFGWYSQIREVL